MAAFREFLLPEARFPGIAVTGYCRASSAPVGEEISSPYMGYRGVRDAVSTPGLLDELNRAGIAGKNHSRQLGE